MKNYKTKRILGIPIFLAVFAGATAIVMLLWNAIIPGVIAGVGALTYWQAAGLIILSRLLLGGLGRHGGHMFHGHCRGDKDHFHHLNEMHDSFHKMSHKDRKEFIRKRMSGFSHGFGDCGCGGKDDYKNQGDNDSGNSDTTRD